jgi:hypothetical protein
VAAKTKSGPGGASRKGKAAGRTTAKVGRPSTAQESGRYTPPIPKSVRKSPPWYGALVLVCMILGVAIIMLNYLYRLPLASHGSPWGLVVGLVLMFAGFLMATRYR